MIPEFTFKQLETLSVAGHRPLVICDVDEVVVHFTRAFEDYLARRELRLDTSSFALNGNIRHRSTDAAVATEAVTEMVDDFFHQHTAELDAIDGAIAALHDLARDSSVVMLTNLPHHARDKRIDNLRKHGLDFPVVTNSGPKGPAIRHLAGLTRETVVFVDDSPGFIASARQHAPTVHLIHFLHDDRFARHIEPFDFVSLRTGSWAEALPHIKGLIGV
jgi:FMN phosphatase YigB (HAD superfamily)